MESLKAVGQLLNGVTPSNEETLVGYAVAVGTAFVAEEGLTAQQVRDIIAESNHDVPGNVGARLHALRGRGLATQRGDGPSSVWRLKPDGIKQFDHIVPRSGEVPSGQRFLDPGKVPDDFYIAAINHLNRAYVAGLYSVVQILARKILENLLIDLLRKKYGMSNVIIWFDPKRGRFLEFSALVETLEARLADFKPFSNSIDVSFVKKMNQFRETGNASAHSIEVLTKKEDVDKVKADLLQLVQVAARALDQMK
jgi:hypothetical protein